MTRLTREWVRKAEADYKVAELLHAAVKTPSHDAVAFHAQQSAEKYLKARLQESGISFSKTHDLLVLVNLGIPVEPALAKLKTRLNRLSKAAVEVRYPGFGVTKTGARAAFRTAGLLREAVRKSLGLRV